MAFGFQRYDLSEITRRIELPEISDPAKPLTLLVRYAGPGNRAWANRMFKWARDKQPPTTESPESTPAAEPTTEEIAKDRLETAQLFAGTSIVGWENAFDDGVLCQFSDDAAVRLLVEMMTHTGDIWRLKVRDYITEIANFRGPVVDPVDLGKEPPRG